MVVSQAEIFAVEGGRGGKASAHVAPGIVQFGRGPVDVEGDLASGTVHRQIAHDLHLAAAVQDALRLELNSRVLLHVEEVRAAQVLIAVGDPRIDRAHVDDGDHLGLSDVLLIQINGAGNIGEVSADVRNG